MTELHSTEPVEREITIEITPTTDVMETVGAGAGGGDAVGREGEGGAVGGGRVFLPGEEGDRIKT